MPARTTTQTLPLAAGQHLQLWLPAGSQLLCQAPHMRVTESAQWQADRLVSRQTRLNDGEGMVLAQEGWVGCWRRKEASCCACAPLARAWYAPWPPCSDFRAADGMRRDGKRAGERRGHEHADRLMKINFRSTNPHHPRFSSNKVAQKEGELTVEELQQPVKLLHFIISKR
jgi:hypothetical protein